MWKQNMKYVLIFDFVSKKVKRLCDQRRQIIFSFFGHLNQSQHNYARSSTDKGERGRGSHSFFLVLSVASLSAPGRQRVPAGARHLASDMNRQAGERRG